MRRLIVPISATLALLTASPVSAQEALGSEGWALTAGDFDLREDAETVQGGVEYRFPAFRFRVPFPGGLEPRLLPAAGVGVTADESVWVYGGLRLDLELSRHWVVTPSFAVSLYDDGDGKDLGGPVEFRSGVELAYRLARGPRLGVAFYHLSNAGIYDENPGVNSLLLTWSFGR